MLHTAVFILSSKMYTDLYYEVAKTALQQFVRNSSSIYDTFFVVYNVHSLLHICDDVKSYGPLDNYSCFPFESYLGKLKRQVRGKYLPFAIC